MISIVAALVFAFSLSLAGSIVLAKWKPRKRITQSSSQERWREDSISRFGGIAIMLSSLAAIALLFALGIVRDVSAPVVKGFFIAFAMGLIGLLDDITSLRPLIKLSLQVLVAVAAVIMGIRWFVFGIIFIDMLITAFWIVAITNAFNLLDNMDGLAGGVAAIGALFCSMILFRNGIHETALITFVFVASMLGFLTRNFPPASLFMGDSGSHFIGAFLAIAVIHTPVIPGQDTIAALAVSLLLVAVPIIDTAFVTVTRINSGRRISVGGRDHISHRMVISGLPERTAVLTLYLASTCFASLAFLI